MIIRYPFSVVKGHQVASGMSINSPYPKGTIALQTPYFKSLGLDLTDYFSGTINAQFDCQQIELMKYSHVFENLNWLKGLPSETFYFAPVKIEYKKKLYRAFVYQPDKQTKIDHFQENNVLELIAEQLPGLNYNEQLELIIEQGFLEIKF
ncbi:hypothetical protein AAD001_09890 [Colwelliaceae bacterium 6471]